MAKKRKSQKTVNFKKIKKRSTRKTKTIKKILVPLDGSKASFHALELALSLSLHYSASITGVHIFDLPITSEYGTIDPVVLRLNKKVKRFMSLAKLRATKKHVTFKQIIKHGKIGPDLITVAKKGKFDLIVIGKRGTSSIGEIFLGSISHYVIHHSKIPVLIVK